MIYKFIDKVFCCEKVYYIICLRDIKEQKTLNVEGGFYTRGEAERAATEEFAQYLWLPSYLKQMINRTSNFCHEFNFVIQSWDYLSNKWFDTKYGSDTMEEAANLEQEILRDDSKWLEGDRKTRVVPAKKKL